MYTSIDKALTALILVVLFFLNRWFGINLGLDVDLIEQIVVAVAPFLVWLVPNKKVT